MMALEQGAVKDLIIWDELKILRNRYVCTAAGTSGCNKTEFTYTDPSATGAMAERPEKIKRFVGALIKEEKDEKKVKEEKGEERKGKGKGGEEGKGGGKGGEGGRGKGGREES